MPILGVQRCGLGPDREQIRNQLQGNSSAPFFFFVTLAAPHGTLVVEKTNAKAEFSLVTRTTAYLRLTRQFDQSPCSDIKVRFYRPLCSF